MQNHFATTDIFAPKGAAMSRAFRMFTTMTIITTTQMRGSIG